jgi:hypothetical protein
MNKPPTTTLRRLAGIAAEPLRIAREMVAIPVELWLVVAELVGQVVLAVWVRLRPLLVALVLASIALVRIAERHVTPARALVAVALGAAIALGASQWADYHEVSVGTGQYSAVEGVASAPIVERDQAGQAHAWVMVPLAAVAVVAIGFGAAGRRRAALALVPIGLVAIGIALIVDVPAGLDEGTATLEYEGAQASLLEGFWAELAAASVLCACGALLPVAWRRTPAGSRRSGRRSAVDRGRERLGVMGASGA